MKSLFRYLDSVIKCSFDKEGTTRYKTGAVILTPAEELPKDSSCIIPDGMDRGRSLWDFVSVEETPDGFEICISLEEDQGVFGLGQGIGCLNKRGRIYEMYNTDEPDHAPSKTKLYSTLPVFYLISPRGCIGFFLDHAGYSRFDVGSENRELLRITIEGPGFDFYAIPGSPESILKSVLELTGSSLFLPIWALGFQQSRWSYPDEKTVLDIANKMRQKKIPCDVIYLDIDYMDDYKVFTWNEERFPTPRTLIDELKSMGLKVVTIIDPGVKAAEGYEVFEEGRQRSLFCKRVNGTEYRPAVWPGESRLPDFLNSKTREWWGSKYSQFIDVGVAGFWNDMNEPAIFYTPESLSSLFELAKGLEKDKGIDTEFLFGEIVAKKRYHDYGREFYQEDDFGTKHLHRNVRNVYGFNMARAAYEGIERSAPERRIFNITRSSYPGIQRYAILWTGDNESQWEQLLSEIRMVQSISLAGISFTGCDVGGFGGNCTGELLARWTQFGAFLPFFRNHSAIGTRDQEPWAFDEEIESIVRKTIEMRYSLLPYIYSENWRSTKGESVMIRPLVLLWPEDSDTYQADDQYMFGPSLLVAPVYSPNATGRHVYLPESNWLDLNSGEVLAKGHHWAIAPLDTIPLYLRENSMIITTKPLQHIESASWNNLRVKGFVKKSARFDLYEDDGITRSYERGVFSLKRIEVEKREDGIFIEILPSEGELRIEEREIIFEIFDGERTYSASVKDCPEGMALLIK